MKAQRRQRIPQFVVQVFDPPFQGGSTLSLPLALGCAALALGYFRWLPTGADRSAAQRMADVVIHLELLEELPLLRREQADLTGRVL